MDNGKISQPRPENSRKMFRNIRRERKIVLGWGMVLLLLTWNPMHAQPPSPVEPAPDFHPRTEGRWVLEPDFQSFDRGAFRSVRETYGERAYQLLKSLTPPQYWDHPEFGLLPFNTDCDSCIELIHLRTRDQRVYVDLRYPRSRYYLQGANGPLSYRDDRGWWRTINWYLQPENGIFRSRQPEMMTELDTVTSILRIYSDNYALEYTGQTRLEIYRQQMPVFSERAQKPVRNRVGSSGVYQHRVFPGLKIDRRLRVSRLRIMVEYVFSENPFEILNFLDPSDVLVFRDTFHLQGLQVDLPGGNIASEIPLLPVQSGEVQEMKWLRPVLLDAHGRVLKSLQYEVVSGTPANLLVWEIRIPADIFLTAEFPVILDPVLTISGSSALTCGFGHDGSGGGTIFCPCQITLTGLGGTTLTNAIYTISWESNCGTNCSVSWGWFQWDHDHSQSHGWVKVYSYACNVEDPPGSFYWTCSEAGCGPPSCSTPAGTHSCGTCSGSPVSIPSFVTCLTPQCPDYTLTFESRNYHIEFCNWELFFGWSHYCGCQIPCDQSTGQCLTYELFMSAGNFTVTVEGRTVEGTWSRNNGNPDTLTVSPCPSTSFQLCETPQYGVPGYTFDWFRNGSFIGNGSGLSHCITDNPPPGLNLYVVQITDQCGNVARDTVYVIGCPLGLEDLQVEVLADNPQNVQLIWRYEGERDVERFIVRHGRQIHSLEAIGEVLPIREGGIQAGTWTPSEPAGYWQIEAQFRDGSPILLSEIVYIPEGKGTYPIRVRLYQQTLWVDLSQWTISGEIPIVLTGMDGKIVYQRWVQPRQEPHVQIPLPTRHTYLLQVGEEILIISPDFPNQKTSSAQ